MSQAVSPSIDRVYGLARVTRCWNVSRATVYRHRQAPVVPKRRPGPVGPCDDATLLEHIKTAIAESLFTGEGYRKIWARLRLKENFLWVRHFESIEELRLALLDFAAWYNTHWLVARHGHRTPAQIRADQQPAMDQAA